MWTLFGLLTSIRGSYAQESHRMIVCMRRLQASSKKQVAPERTFHCRQVTDGVHGRVQVGENGPDIRSSRGEDQWRIIPDESS